MTLFLNGKKTKLKKGDSVVIEDYGADFFTIAFKRKYTPIDIGGGGDKMVLPVEGLNDGIRVASLIAQILDMNFKIKRREDGYVVLELC